MATPMRQTPTMPARHVLAIHFSRLPAPSWLVSQKKTGGSSRSVLGVSPRRMVGSPRGPAGTSAWPSLRRANPPRRLNNALIPPSTGRRLHAYFWRHSWLPSGGHNRSGYCPCGVARLVPMGIFPLTPAPVIPSRPQSPEALQARWERLRSWSIPSAVHRNHDPNLWLPRR